MSMVERVSVLRPVDAGDHEFLVELHNDPVVLRNLTNPLPITMRHHMSWWRKVNNDHMQSRMIFEVDGERVGVTKFYAIDKHNRSCMLGADIHASHRGRGHAKTMWSLMLERCFNDLGLHRVCLTTAEYNVVAQHVYKSIGFIEEGRLVESLYREGKYWDQVCMYMLEEHWRARR